jgi:hypothetical protein
VDTLVRISNAYGLPEPADPRRDTEYWDKKMDALMEYLGVTVVNNRGRSRSHERSSRGLVPTNIPGGSGGGSYHPLSANVGPQCVRSKALTFRIPIHPNGDRR